MLTTVSKKVPDEDDRLHVKSLYQAQCWLAATHMLLGDNGTITAKAPPSDTPRIQLLLSPVMAGHKTAVAKVGQIPDRLG